MIAGMLEDNRPRWDGTRAGFYEVWFLKLNHRASGTALWVRYTTLAPADAQQPARGQVWAIFFDPADPSCNVAGLCTVPRGEVRLGGDALVALAGARYAEGHAGGAVRAEGVPVRWDLRYEPAATTFHHVPGLVAAVVPTRVCSPNVDVRVHGSFQVGERAFTCEGEPAQQGHIWGTRHGHRWTWAHCNAFEGAEGAVFEGLTAQVRVLGLESPPLTALLIRLDGEDHVFNSPWSMWTTPSWHRLGGWRFEATRGARRYRGEVSAQLADIVGVIYTDTDLSPVYCHNTKVASMVLHVDEKHGGAFRPVRTLIARKTCALELVDRTSDPRVPMRIGGPSALVS